MKKTSQSKTMILNGVLAVLSATFALAIELAKFLGDPNVAAALPSAWAPAAVLFVNVMNIVLRYGFTSTGIIGSPTDPNAGRAAPTVTPPGISGV